jgi:hypothetical protein
MSNAGMPRDLMNAKKRPKKEKNACGEAKKGQTGDAGTAQIGMRTKDLAIVFDEGRQCLVGISGTDSYVVLGTKASAGEVWSCGILHSNGMGMYHALPMSIIKEARKEEDEPGEVQKADSTTIEAPIEILASAGQPEDPRIAAMQARIDELEGKLKEKNAKHRDVILKYGRVLKKLGQAEKVADELKQKDITISSLKEQVKGLERKIGDRDIGNLESERDRYMALADEKDAEIARLKEILALYESGAKETAVTTFLTGFTGIHCNMLGEGRYRVYFSPGKRTLRFVPDYAGDVVCPGGNVSIPAIGRFTHFEKVRALEAVTEGMDIVISLA